MKIDQNVTFLKNAADTSNLKSATEGVNAYRSSGIPTADSQTRSSSPIPLLPSTNGDFDAARVAKIRADISAGRYQVNSAKIADGLLASVRDLIGKKAP